MMTFVQVVEAHSFSAAARALDTTPSAVSKQIRRIEDRLSIRLFYRTTRHITLTEEGQTYYRRCVHILDEIEAAEQAVTSLAQEPQGTLRIAATVSFGRVEILPRINRFIARHPRINIEFELTDRHVDLVDEGIDVAIQWREQIEDSSIIARKLCVNRRIICASPGYLARHTTPTQPEGLRDHNCLTLSTLDRFNDWAFQDPERGERVLRVGGNFRSNTADGLHEAVLSGIGLARLSTWLVAPDLHARRLVQVLPEYPHDFSAFYVLYPHRRHLSRKVRAFVDFLVEQFTPIPPWERDGLTRPTSHSGRGTG